MAKRFHAEGVVKNEADELKVVVDGITSYMAENPGAFMAILREGMAFTEKQTANEDLRKIIYNGVFYGITIGMAKAILDIADGKLDLSIARIDGGGKEAQQA